MYLNFKNMGAVGRRLFREAIDDVGGDTLARSLIATGLSNTTKLISFNTAIPFDASYVMASHLIDTAVVFTPQANRVAGSSCYVRLTSDGIHLPIFAVMAEHGSSAGWDGTPGVVNLITFWFDGVQTLYSISQTIGATNPAVVNAVVISYQTPTTITLTFTTPISPAIVPPATSFTLTNSGGSDTVSDVQIIGGAVVLTKSRTTASTDTITVAYTAPQNDALVDTNGNLVSSFVGRTVTYTAAPAPLKVVRLTTLNHVDETGNGTTGYNYVKASSAPGPSYTNSPKAVAWSSACIPAGQDGFIQCKIEAIVDHNVLLGLSDRPSPAGGYSDMYLGIYQDSSYTGYQPFFNYTNYGSSSAVAEVGDIMRVRRQGTTGYFEISKDNGATFSTSASVNNISTAALYPVIQLADATARCVNLRGSSNIA